jgi:hypothetical protein
MDFNGVAAARTMLHVLSVAGNLAGFMLTNDCFALDSGLLPSQIA